MYLPHHWNPDAPEVHSLAVSTSSGTAEKQVVRRRLATELAGDSNVRVIYGAPAPGTTFDATVFCAGLDLLQKEALQKQESAIVAEHCPSIIQPKGVALEDFFDAPFLPVLMSARGRDQGEGKWFLDEPLQLAKVKAVQELLRNKKSIFAANNLSWLQTFLMKEFIESPSEHYTSYRILMSATGELLAAGLLYSQNRKTANDFEVISSTGSYQNLVNDDWGAENDNYFLSPESPYFLEAKKVVSNSGAGGGIIPIGPNVTRSYKPNAMEGDILRSHGIEDHHQIPNELFVAAREVMAAYGKRLTLVAGIDFIQGQDGKLYYLETNAVPGLKTYIKSRGNENQSELEAYDEVLRSAIRGIIEMQQ